MDAEKEKRESEERHQLATTKCANCEKKLKQLEKKFSKSIQKAGLENATTNLSKFSSTICKGFVIVSKQFIG